MIATVEMRDEVDWAPATELEEVLQNVRMIVGVWQSEVPLDREFGIDTALIDAPVNAAYSRLLAELTEKIPELEPRAALKKLEVETTEDGAVQTLITVEVTI